MNRHQRLMILLLRVLKSIRSTAAEKPRERFSRNSWLQRRAEQLAEELAAVVEAAETKTSKTAVL